MTTINVVDLGVNKSGAIVVMSSMVLSLGFKSGMEASIASSMGQLTRICSLLLGSIID